MDPHSSPYITHYSSFYFFLFLHFQLTEGQLRAPKPNGTPYHFWAQDSFLDLQKDPKKMEPPDNPSGFLNVVTGVILVGSIC